MPPSSSNHSAVSPVVAVILMVAVTVILSAVIGTFVLNLGEQTSDSPSTGQAATSIQTNGNGTVTVQLVTSKDAITRVEVSNGTATFNLSSVGDSVTLSADNESITVVAVKDGERTVLQTYDPSSATVTSSGPSMVTDGLMHRWLANKSTSTKLVDDISGLNATELNGVSYQTVDGVQAVMFDGSGSAGADSFTSGDLHASNMSISFWVNPNSIPSSGERTIIWSGESGTTKDMLGITLQSNRWRLSAMDGGANKFNIYGGSPTAGVWQHVVAVGNQSTVRLYVNGTLVAENTSFSGGWNYYSGNEEIMGAYDGSGGDQVENYNGSLHDFRAYNRALNVSEVQTIYDNGP